MSDKNTKFNPVDPNPNFIDMEKKLLEEWYSTGLVQKYLDKNKTSDKNFSFLDGPITANNPMGVHHAWGRTYKDLWQRYKNMKGYKQRFQNGFDCQGLWVEVQVEKDLGLKSKKDIENLVPGDQKASIAKFVEICRERVYKYANMQTEQSKRLGYFMDWDNSYYTLSEDNNYMIWHFLRKCHEKGLIYKGHDSVPWCPRCGTAISQHEILTENYEEVSHTAIYFKLPVEGRDFSLLVWTTTPWTIAANVAVAVDPEADYTIADVEGEKLVVMFARAKEVLGLVSNDIIKGKELVGLEYIGPYDDLPAVKKEFGDYIHRVVAADPQILPVSSEEGTGLVHVAPGAGAEDFALGKKEKFPVVGPINDEAVYVEGFGELTGKNVKDVIGLVITHLDTNGFLFKKENYKHRYPRCWRCSEELVWRVVDEWYISMGSLREPMKAITKKINWIPEFGLKRELDWLDNMHDWLISKKRYWGLALPVWECSPPAGGCGWFDVIGGREELQEKASEGWEKFEGNTPHRPFIDEVKVKCEKCGAQCDRISDVGNPWLDAGIVPYSTIAENNQGAPLYKTNKEKWQKWLPADFVTESFPGQFKNWFYSLIAMSTVLENEEPFKTVLGFATLLAEDGRAMHKSWGNSIEFNEGADKMGADVMRWIYIKQDPTQNLLFGYKIAEQTRRRFYLILWNSYKFFVDYANLSGWSCDSPHKSDIKEKLTILDRWVLARLTEVCLGVNKSLDEYDSTTAATTLEEFILNDLSTWYIRRSRDRVGFNTDSQDKEVFMNVCYGVLVTLTKLLAPFMPFVSEEMYKNLTGDESVHLTNYPQGDKSLLDDDLVTRMILVRKIVEAGHAARKESEIPVRQPLLSATFKFNNDLSDELKELIKDELNVKNVVWNMEKGLKEPEVELDTKLTPELEEEGKTRDLARKIQEERKKLRTALSSRVEVISEWLPENKVLLDWLQQKTLASSIVKGSKLEVKEVKK